MREKWRAETIQIPIGQNICTHSRSDLKEKWGETIQISIGRTKLEGIRRAPVSPRQQIYKHAEVREERVTVEFEQVQYSAETDPIQCRGRTEEVRIVVILYKELSRLLELFSFSKFLSTTQPASLFRKTVFITG